MQNYKQPGENITVLQSLLIHPDHTGLDVEDKVVSGDQCVVGTLTGVSVFTATATTDQAVIKTKGVFDLPVIATNAGGNSAVAIGDELFIDAGAHGAISKNASKVPLGIALATVAAGATAVIEVKLHE